MSRLSDTSDEDAIEASPKHKKAKRAKREEEFDHASFQSFRPTKMSTLYTSNASNNDDESDESDDEHRPTFSMATFDQKNQSPHPPADGYGIGSKMMKKLGYVAGEGLGKNKQGRVEPVGLSTQQGRRGIGFETISKGKPYEGPSWDSEKEEIPIEEQPIWMSESPMDEISRDELENGISIGLKKHTIDDEYTFCSRQTLDDILSLKTLFDTISKEKLRGLVGRCNMYESIENVFFINRAALKMANIDRVFDYMFTSPKTEEGAQIVGHNDLLYFADVCAGPGGFSEYVLWKKKWRAKGFGFTLRGENDFKLSNMLAGPTDSFFPYYGARGDGDIFDPENLMSLKSHVLKHTDDKGVHFLMADGGFSVEGEENIQEIRSKQLYLCQCIAALSLVREDGHFVVKLFDIFTEFSVGLIYLMYRSFKRICIHKPVTSRPANSERYLICKWKRASSDTIERYLFHVNERLSSFSRDKQQQDVIKLVPLDTILDDSDFFQYIRDSNDRIGAWQISNLLKVNESHLNPLLLDNLHYDNNLTHEEKRVDVRRKLLEFWEIPDEKRKTAKRPSAAEVLKKISEKSNISHDTFQKIFSHQPKIIKTESDLKIECSGKSSRDIVNSVYDWYFIYCNSMSSSKFHFYLGLGGLSVCRSTGRSWEPFNGISLPEGTLIFAEDVEEMRGSGRGIHKSHSLHIIDAFSLGYEHIHQHCFTWRYKQIKLFCTSLDIPSTNRSENITYPLRPKKLYTLMDLHIVLDELTERILKNSQPAMTASVPNSKENADMYFVVNGLRFFKFTKDPWVSAFSKSNKSIYYYNTTNQNSNYDVKSGSFSFTHDSLLTSFCCQYTRDGDNYVGGLGVILKKCLDAQGGRM